MDDDNRLLEGNFTPMPIEKLLYEALRLQVKLTKSYWFKKIKFIWRTGGSPAVVKRFTALGEPPVRRFHVTVTKK